MAFILVSGIGGSGDRGSTLIRPFVHLHDYLRSGSLSDKFMPNQWLFDAKNSSIVAALCECDSITLNVGVWGCLCQNTHSHWCSEVNDGTQTTHMLTTEKYTFHWLIIIIRKKRDTCCCAALAHSRLRNGEATQRKMRNMEMRTFSFRRHSNPLLSHGFEFIMICH